MLPLPWLQRDKEQRSIGIAMQLGWYTDDIYTMNHSLKMIPGKAATEPFTQWLPGNQYMLSAQIHKARRAGPAE
jgi:hypothetical protein